MEFFRAFSDRKTGPAATGRGRVRVLDLERRADQLCGKVDLRPLQKLQAHLVDQHTCPVAFDHDIIRIYSRREVKLVGKARTSPTFYGHAQIGGAVLFGENRINPLRSRSSQCHIRGNGLGHGPNIRTNS